MQPVVKAKFHIGNLGRISSVLASSYAQTSAFQGGDYANSAISVVKPTGINPFILDFSELNSGAVYENSYNGLLSGENHISSEDYDGESNGYMNTSPYNIHVSGVEIKSITINFDNRYGSYATKLIIPNINLPNGGIIYNNTPSFTFMLPKDSSPNSLSGVNIKLYALSKPNSPVMITSIIIKSDIEISSNDGLISITRGSQSVSDFELPSYGVVSQYGNIKFIDTPDEYFNILSSGGFLEDDIPVELYINDNMIGKYHTAGDWSYNSYNNHVKVSLESNITQMQQKYCSFNLLNHNLSDTGLLDAFKYLLEYLGDGSYKFLNSLENEMVYQGGLRFVNNVANVGDYTIDFNDVVDYLSKFKTPFIYFEDASVWEQLNKVCNAFQLVMYDSPKGIIKVVRRI